MINVLILGLSDIATRRLLPALRAMPGIGAIDAATRRGTAREDFRNVYLDYADALARSDAELVYVSLVNSLHHPWALASLRADRHTIVDKPACLDHAQTVDLCELADRRSRCIAEATVFAYHPQFRLIEALAAEHGRLTRVVASFSFPALPDANFRNDPSLGGGALADLGPYVAGLARLHFDSPLAHCDCRVLSRHPSTGVETAFSVSLTFEDGGSLVGHFGFDTQYQNRVLAFGPTWSYQLNRAFTTPPEMANELALSGAGGTRTVATPPGDAFALFLDAVAGSIERGDWRAFNRDLIADSALRDRLARNSSGETR